MIIIIIIIQYFLNYAVYLYGVYVNVTKVICLHCILWMLKNLIQIYLNYATNIPYINIFPFLILLSASEFARL